MTSKDLHNCAQLLSKMLEKDSSDRSVARNKAEIKKPCRSSKAFVTTGRLPRKVASSKSTRAKPVVVPGRSRSLVRQGIDHRTEEDSLSLEFAASRNGKTGSEEMAVHIPTGDVEPAYAKEPNGSCISPPATVLFNHRLTSSTPNETPRKIIDLGNTLILNGSTKTQVLNSTDEVRAMRTTEKNGPIHKLTPVSINFVSNPHVTRQLFSSEPEGVRGHPEFVSDLETNRRFVSQDRQPLGQIHSPKKPVKTCLDVPTSDVAIGVSTCSVGVGNSMNGFDYGNSLLSVGVGKSMHSIGVGNSLNRSDAENFFLNRSHHTQEKPREYSDDCAKTCSSTVKTPVKGVKTSGHHGLTQTRRSGSMVDLSSCRKDEFQRVACSSISFNVPQTSDIPSAKHDVDKKDSAMHRSLTAGNDRNCGSNGCGDFNSDEFASRFNASGVELEDSETSRLVLLLKRVKNAVNEKQNCRISRLISEIQDVVLNTSSSVELSPMSDLDRDLALQPLRSENSQLRRRVRILNQQLRDKDTHLEAAKKPDPSFQVLHLSMLNDHLGNQVSQQKQEIASLLDANLKLQENDEKLVKEKADLLIALAKKDDSHIKSLQDKMREIAKVKTELDGMRREKKKNDVERLHDKIKDLELKVAQKDAEIENAEELFGDVHDLTNQLVHDLQSSPWTDVLNNGNLQETVQKILHLTRRSLREKSGLEDQFPTVIEVCNRSLENNLGDSKHLRNSLNEKPESAQKDHLDLHKFKAIGKSFSDEPLKNFAASVENRNFADSKSASVKNVAELSYQADWPSCGVTVKELMRPMVNYNIQPGRVGDNTRSNPPIFRDSLQAGDDVTVDFLDRSNVTIPVALNLTDMTRDSFANYFQEYCSEVDSHSQKHHRLSCTPSVCSEISPPTTPQDQSLSRNVESPVSEEFAMRLSRRSSSTETDPRDFNHDGKSREWKSELGENGELRLDLASLVDEDADSPGTTLTLSSLETLSIVDELAFKDSLASLDANIAQIQENLRQNLALKFSKLSDLHDDFKII